MFAYTVRRVFAGMILLVVMSMITFVLFFASSEQPERFACGPKCTQQQLETTRVALGYDEPIYIQWGKFAKGVVAGRQFPEDEKLKQTAPELITECPAPCLGYSQGYNTPVARQDLRRAADLGLPGHRRLHPLDDRRRAASG